MSQTYGCWSPCRQASWRERLRPATVASASRWETAREGAPPAHRSVDDPAGVGERQPGEVGPHSLEPLIVGVRGQHCTWARLRGPAQRHVPPPGMRRRRKFMRCSSGSPSRRRIRSRSCSRDSAERALSAASRSISLRGGAGRGEPAFVCGFFRGCFFFAMAMCVSVVWQGWPWTFFLPLFSLQSFSESAVFRDRASRSTLQVWARLPDLARGSPPVCWQ